MSRFGTFPISIKIPFVQKLEIYQVSLGSYKSCLQFIWKNYWFGNFFYPSANIVSLTCRKWQAYYCTAVFRLNLSPLGNAEWILREWKKIRQSFLPSPSPFFLPVPPISNLSESFGFCGSLEDIFLKPSGDRGKRTKGTGSAGLHTHKMLGRGLLPPHTSPLPLQSKPGCASVAHQGGCLSHVFETVWRTQLFRLGQGRLEGLGQTGWWMEASGGTGTPLSWPCQKGQRPWTGKDILLKSRVQRFVWMCVAGSLQDLGKGLTE